MKITLTGGCVCGGVRYEGAAESAELVMFRCHCRDCQHITGGPYAPVVFMPRTAFKLTRGAIKHHVTPSAMGGEHKRGFCADCGSRLTGGEGMDSGGIGVTASSLDDPTLFRPQFDIWVHDAQPWDLLDPTVTKHEKYAPQ